MKPAANTKCLLLLAQVVTQPTEWKRGLVAISNFGFGGSNVHCILGGPAGSAGERLAIAPAGEEIFEDEAKEVRIAQIVLADLAVTIARFTTPGFL